MLEEVGYGCSKLRILSPSMALPSRANLEREQLDERLKVITLVIGERRNGVRVQNVQDANGDGFLVSWIRGID